MNDEEGGEGTSRCYIEGSPRSWRQDRIRSRPRKDVEKICDEKENCIKGVHFVQKMEKLIGPTERKNQFPAEDIFRIILGPIKFNKLGKTF